MSTTAWGYASAASEEVCLHIIRTTDELGVFEVCSQTNIFAQSIPGLVEMLDSDKYKLTIAEVRLGLSTCALMLSLPDGLAVVLSDEPCQVTKLNRLELGTPQVRVQLGFQYDTVSDHEVYDSVAGYERGFGVCWNVEIPPK